MPDSFRGQTYAKLKKGCVKKGVLFEDPEFPANNKSLFFSKVDNDIEWKRPMELCKVPKLIVEGVSCDDLNQGELGNTWFVTACSSLALEPKLWRIVVANHKEQEWDEKNQYAGIFHFVFWRYGSWTDVVIDDRLPTKNGKLVFCHSQSRNEFWSALLEKAYAKLYGDYESLTYGYVADALVDFTGGVSEKLMISDMMLDLHENRNALFGKLQEAIELKAFINCSIHCAPEMVGQESEHGLIFGKGYNVTDIKLVNVSRSLQGAVGTDKLMLVRLFNPWGTREWTGPWSDSSPEWKSINAREWEKMGIKFKQEGEFWMSFDDFLRNFTNIDICHFVNTSFFSLKKTWTEAIIHSKWSHSGRNGGRDFYSNTFLSNPQILFDITGLQETIMVSLEQHDVGAGRQFLGQKLNTIGFHIMKVEDNRKYRVHIVGDKMFTSPYNMSRSVFGTCVLKKGRYVIVPTTVETGQVGDFMLRLYTSGSSNSSKNPFADKELTKEGPSRGCPCGAKYQLVTTVTVESADELQLPPKAKGSCDPMVFIKCEGETVKSMYCQGTTSPVWNIKATFYRKKPDLPIIVEIWNHNMVINDFIGEARIDDIGNEQGVKKTFDIWGRKKEKDDKKPGHLKVNVRSSHDLTYL
ncbi:calpain-5-like isoform X2 [Gigantopelta aegis]|uniref:calpain-5-like isoform X2 n=1 Tax=Gigantopelta aegis TaxID=1735272 RepID=UPI001B88C06B|nr:calpain-5-like isoform X2 [Gigantopelta aegis]